MERETSDCHNRSPGEKHTVVTVPCLVTVRTESASCPETSSASPDFTVTVRQRDRARYPSSDRFRIRSLNRYGNSPSRSLPVKRIRE